MASTGLGAVLLRSDRPRVPGRCRGAPAESLRATHPSARILCAIQQVSRGDSCNFHPVTKFSVFGYLLVNNFPHASQFSEDAAGNLGWDSQDKHYDCA